VRTVLSPEPEASRLPSGENCTASTDSVWPAMAAEQRVTARTRNSACGWNTMRSTPSTDTCSAARQVSFGRLRRLFELWEEWEMKRVHPRARTHTHEHGHDDPTADGATSLQEA
jgi:hypothetical protein